MTLAYYILMFSLLQSSHNFEFQNSKRVMFNNGVSSAPSVVEDDATPDESIREIKRKFFVHFPIMNEAVNRSKGGSIKRYKCTLKQAYLV